GLGAQEQGATDHIKVQVKNDHLGLGAAISNEDNWIAHQDGFNQLLAELNNCHGQETADFSDDKKKKSFSLEEKSKVSKNRVHYMKFTKGKDLSCRSKKDLDCIFGKRQSKKASEGNPSPSPPDGNETTTTTSAFTIQEYFAKRMAELRNKSQVPAPGPGASESRVGCRRGRKRNREATGKHVEPKAEQPGREQLEGEESPRGAAPQDRCGDESSEACAEGVATSPNGQGFILKSKKRKGKKKLRRPVEVAVDTMLEEMPVAKKKKKKKGSR
ncbi:PIN2/TERF1-interacting telomerase inhibitor 1, partial [Carlito syrichta]|uniref:PIN2/TERF1-interacting telomerase inhibitor 1 n=1 Tax=Carlito syrichta TaxID=1868482 RepID=A0A1U7SYD6_CARSF